jgi:hypothetical protein
MSYFVSREKQIQLDHYGSGMPGLSRTILRFLRFLFSPLPRNLQEQKASK